MKLHLAMFEAIHRVLDDPILVGDNAQPVFTSNYLVDCESPRSYFNSGTGYCTLGYALPAAIGARIGQPDRPVVCISGDGGFMFTLSELACAVQERLPIIVVVWNNLGYREIRKIMVERDVEPVGVALHTPDFALLARAFACEYESVTTLAGLESALKRTHPARGPVLIEIHEQELIEGDLGVDLL
jgi:acetolactate synthase-1/2/3 large subunit